MATNMKENGFETMIVKYLVENNHYEEGSNSDYNKIYAIDEVRLFRFLHDTQYEKLAELRIEDNEIEKKKFLDRLSKKISDDGVINIIRKGMKYKNSIISDAKILIGHLNLMTLFYEVFFFYLKPWRKP